MTIEQELFSWQAWDGDQELMTFYDPVLKVQIGHHPVGSKFDVAFINYGNIGDKGPYLQLDVGESSYTYKLHLRVGEQIHV